MALEKIIKEKMTSLMQFADNLLIEIESKKTDLQELVEEIISKDIKKEDCTDLIIKQRVLMSYAYLMNDDLRRTLIEVTSLYKVVKLAKIDLDISEEDVERLEFNIQNELLHFIEVKGEIVAKDSSLLNKIEERFDKSKKNTSDDFLTNLRNSPMYAEKSKK